MAMTESIVVEVAYASPQRQVILSVQVEAGCPALVAVQRSGICEMFPELNGHALSLGIFGKAIKPEQPLRAKDRVEIYRPLIADPKEVRRAAWGQGRDRDNRSPA